MSPKQEAALPHRPVSPVIFRGEKDGELRQLGGVHQPWFFTERPDHALLYSGKSKRDIPHKPIACRLTSDGSTKVLDLTNLRPTNKDHIRLLDLLTEEFRSEGWVCRYSGEEREAYSFIEGGDLYDYEGTGTGERWNRLFEIAFAEMEFDAVRLPDRTDGTQGAASIVWVTHRKDLLCPATMGEELAALIHRPKDRDGFIEEFTSLFGATSQMAPTSAPGTGWPSRATMPNSTSAMTAIPLNSCSGFWPATSPGAARTTTSFSICPRPGSNLASPNGKTTCWH